MQSQYRQEPLKQRKKCLPGLLPRWIMRVEQYYVHGNTHMILHIATHIHDTTYCNTHTHTATEPGNKVSSYTQLQFVDNQSKVEFFLQAIT